MLGRFFDMVAFSPAPNVTPAQAGASGGPCLVP